MCSPRHIHGSIRDKHTHCLYVKGTAQIQQIPLQLRQAVLNHTQAVLNHIKTNYILNKSKMFTLSHVAHLNVNNFYVLHYRINRTESAFFLVVEMLKNIDFQGSYGHFSKTSG